MPLAKRKQTTNEFYRSVLDDAVRDEWHASERKPTKKKMNASRRLSSLYGCNVASKHVQRRTSVAVKPGASGSAGPLAMMQAAEAQRSSAAAEAERQRTPGYTRKQSQASVAPPFTEGAKKRAPCCVAAATA